MALASELAIRAKIVETIQSVTGVAHVYPRYRRPPQGQLAAFKELFFDEAQARINFWTVRRVQRNPEVDDFNTIEKVVQVYQIVGHESLVDSDDDALASEAVFQARIEAIAEAFESGLIFELDGVTHRGLQVPSDIQDVMLGSGGEGSVSFLCHQAICRLTVDVEDC